MPLGILQIWFLYHDYFIKNYNFTDPVRISILNFFVFILGIVASHYKDDIVRLAGKFKFLLAGVSAALAFSVFYEGRILYYKTYNIGAFYSQYRPSVLLYTLSIGSFMLAVFENVREEVFNVIKELSQLSYLVFFIHVIILEEIWKYFGHNIFNLPAFDLIFFTSVAALSFGVAYLIHKIPHLSKLTG
jgi:hypothetical protein